MLKLAKSRSKLKVVNDQIGAPTYATDIAVTSMKIIEQIQSKKVSLTKPEILNYAGDGETSWYDFAAYIFKTAGIDIKVKGIPSKEYPTKAARPKWSVLDMELIKTTYGIKPKFWKESVKDCLKVLGK